MDLQNPWFVIAIFGVLASYHAELIAEFLNLSRLPKRSEAAEGNENLIEYNSAMAKADVVRSSAMLALLLGFWFVGGFGWLDQWTRSFGYSPLITGVILIATLTLAQNLASLPFDVYHTFGIEAKFGFNRTTPGTFIGDRMKGLVIGGIVGLPVISLILWMFEKLPQAALYSWITLTVFSIFLSWLAPRFIMPLFLKFEPLPDGALRERILSLAQTLAFPVAEVSVVDGSRRSTKANAFFAGFGKNKRIALFDTLIQTHNEDEIAAVLAHEIGHFKRKHVIQQMVFGFLQMGVILGLLHYALRSPQLFSAFGVRQMSAGMGLVLFMMVVGPLSSLIEIVQLMISRRFEYQADAYAAEAMGSSQPLVTALGKLSHDHLSHPSPHPFYVWLHHSHPPLSERLAALTSKA
jgi:STE24 endopeptidase